MSLSPDDIRRIASVLTTVADCEERAHAPLLTTLHAVVDVPAPTKPSGPEWRDCPDALLYEVERVGAIHALRFLRLERGPHGWNVIWRRMAVAFANEKHDGVEIASTPQSTPEIVLRAELARLNSIRPGELA